MKKKYLTKSIALTIVTTSIIASVERKQDYINLIQGGNY